MRSSDWSSDVCSSDLDEAGALRQLRQIHPPQTRRDLRDRLCPSEPLCRGAATRRPSEAGRGHRLCGHHGSRDRAEPALRGPRQRNAAEPREARSAAPPRTHRRRTGAPSKHDCRANRHSADGRREAKTQHPESGVCAGERWLACPPRPPPHGCPSLRARSLLPASSPPWISPPSGRSEEHTSELQSLMRISSAVFCLKKKKKTTTYIQQ